MMRRRWALGLALVVLVGGCSSKALGQTEPSVPTSQAGQTTKLAHMKVDVPGRQVRVECEAITVEAPLEFFCVVNNGPEHESVLRSPVKPSDLHLGLLMLGLKPGEPVRYSDAANKWLPAKGPPLQITVEFQKDGRLVRFPATRLMRHVQTKKEMPATTWIFAGSRVMDDGNYAADVTGYLVSVVNFDLTVIDVPDLRSNANESLEWEVNTEECPPVGTKVTMIIEPAGDEARQPQENVAQPQGPIDAVLIAVNADGTLTMDRKAVSEEEVRAQLRAMKGERPLAVRIIPAPGAVDEKVQAVTAAVIAAGAEPKIISATEALAQAVPAADEQRMKQLRGRWEKAVRPNRDALREAAQAHYDVINQLRDEQQRLIDEADKIQRLIDELERDYQDITTPRPAP